MRVCMCVCGISRAMCVGGGGVIPCACVNANLHLCVKDIGRVRRYVCVPARELLLYVACGTHTLCGSSGKFCAIGGDLGEDVR